MQPKRVMKIINKILLLILFTGASMSAQYVSPRVDLIGILARDLKVFRPSLEYAFHKNLSVNVAYENGKFESGTKQVNFATPMEVYSVKGYGGVGEFRYYPFTKERRAPAGFFVGPYFGYRNISERYTGDDARLSTNLNSVPADITTQGIRYQYGAAIGYKGHIGVFALETVFGFGGANIQWSLPNDRDRLEDIYFDSGGDNLSLRLEINLGLSSRS
jgi:hypothetical protein